jgi:UDP:flavonoid glycosyltransferase YjiC (YdhE family)
MRVLFTTWAWPSHYFPMVPLAWALRAAGHEVRMASQPDLMPTMRASGLPVTAIGRDVDVAAVYRTASEQVRATGSAEPPPGRNDRFSNHLAGSLDTEDLQDGFRTLRNFEDEAISMFRAIWAERAALSPDRLSLYGEVADAIVDELLTLGRSWRPDLIVYDPLTHAGPLVAKLLGIPAVRSLFGPDVTYFIKVTGWGALLDRFGVSEVDLLGAATIDPCPPSLQFPDTMAPTRRLRTQYVPYNGIAEVPSWLPDRPAKPRICLTWGTSIHRLLGDQAFLPAEVLRGCAKLADERDAELVLAITSNQRHLLPEVPENVRVLESVPLNSLLPTCTALFHQGGAGTMLTGLRHGLPQIVLPQLFDEAANAFQIVASGAGLMRGAAGLSAADMLATGHEVLEDPSYRAGAQRLRQEILSLPSPAEVVGELASLAGESRP